MTLGTTRWHRAASSSHLTSRLATYSRPALRIVLSESAVEAQGATGRKGIDPPKCRSSESQSSNYSANPSRPQARVRAELPKVPNRKPIFILAALIALGSWSAFASFATNKERLGSSVFRSVLMQLKDSKEVQDALGGDPIMLVSSMVGDPWVSGSVNMMQGKVDISFKVQGPKDVGTAYFTSIRRGQKRGFEVLRFLLVTDLGETLSLLPSAGAMHDSDGEIESGTALA